MIELSPAFVSQMFYVADEFSDREISGFLDFENEDLDIEEFGKYIGNCVEHEGDLERIGFHTHTKKNLDATAADVDVGDHFPSGTDWLIYFRSYPRIHPVQIVISSSAIAVMTCKGLDRVRTLKRDIHARQLTRTALQMVTWLHIDRHLPFLASCDLAWALAQVRYLDTRALYAFILTLPQVYFEYLETQSAALDCDIAIFETAVPVVLDGMFELEFIFKEKQPETE